MYLFYGVLCIALAVLVFGITLIGSRDPAQPRWASDAMVGNLFGPLVVGLAALGVCSLIQFLVRIASAPPDLTEWLAAAAAAGVTVLLYKMLGVRKRLAAYARAAGGVQVIAPDFQAPRQERQPEPPVKPQPGQRKAA